MLISKTESCPRLFKGFKDIASHEMLLRDILGLELYAVEMYLCVLPSTHYSLLTFIFESTDVWLPLPSELETINF
jgi:hypothetical protein